MSKIIDLTGKKFGKLTVLKRIMTKKSCKAHWLCECDCGNFTVVRGTNLTSGNTKSCGCIWHIKNGRKPTHNKSETRLYRVFQSMKSRCYYKKAREFKSYGGKGVQICQEWLDDFMNFYNWAFANGYNENAKFGECTIDRINPNGNYEPNNCRWITIQEQQKTRNCNKKRKRKLTDDEVLKIFYDNHLKNCQLARLYEVPHSTIYKIKKKLTRKYLFENIS